MEILFHIDDVSLFFTLRCHFFAWNWNWVLSVDTIACHCQPRKTMDDWVVGTNLLSLTKLCIVHGHTLCVQSNEPTEKWEGEGKRERERIWLLLISSECRTIRFVYRLSMVCAMYNTCAIVRSVICVAECRRRRRRWLPQRSVIFFRSRYRVQRWQWYMTRRMKAFSGMKRPCLCTVILWHCERYYAVQSNHNSRVDNVVKSFFRPIRWFAHEFHILRWSNSTVTQPIHSHAILRPPTQSTASQIWCGFFSFVRWSGRTGNDGRQHRYRYGFVAAAITLIELTKLDFEFVSFGTARCEQLAVVVWLRLQPMQMTYTFQMVGCGDVNAHIYHLKRVSYGLISFGSASVSGII